MGDRDLKSPVADIPSAFCSADGVESQTLLFAICVLALEPVWARMKSSS